MPWSDSSKTGCLRISLVAAGIAAVSFGAPLIMGKKLDGTDSHYYDSQYVDQQIIEALDRVRDGKPLKQEFYKVETTRTIVQMRWRAPKKGDYVGSLMTGAWGEVIESQQFGSEYVIGVEWQDYGLPANIPPPGDVFIKIEPGRAPKQ